MNYLEQKINFTPQLIEELNIKTASNMTEIFEVGWDGQAGYFFKEGLTPQQKLNAVLQLPYINMGFVTRITSKDPIEGGVERTEDLQKLVQQYLIDGIDMIINPFITDWTKLFITIKFNGVESIVYANKPYTVYYL